MCQAVAQMQMNLPLPIPKKRAPLIDVKSVCRRVKSNHASDFHKQPCSLSGELHCALRSGAPPTHTCEPVWPLLLLPLTLGEFGTITVMLGQVGRGGTPFWNNNHDDSCHLRSQAAAESEIPILKKTIELKANTEVLLSIYMSSKTTLLFYVLSWVEITHYTIEQEWFLRF